MLRRVLILMSFCLMVFLVWRGIVDYAMPRGVDVEGEAVRAEVKKASDLADLQLVVNQLDLAMTEMRSELMDQRDFVEKSSRTIAVKPEDMPRVADLEQQFRTLKRRVDDELQKMSSLRTELEAVAKNVEAGRLYGLQVAEVKKKVDTRLGAFESENRQVQMAIHDRLDQWNDTLTFFAGILALLMTIITGVAGLVLFFRLHPTGTK